MRVLGTAIEIIGTQNADGSVMERVISVWAGKDSICFDSPQSAREAAADMLAAADDWEAALPLRWTARSATGAATSKPATRWPASTTSSAREQNSRRRAEIGQRPRDYKDGNWRNCGEGRAQRRAKVGFRNPARAR